jgi:hypothetical protein
VFVAPTDDQYGLGRLFQIERERSGQETSMHVVHTLPEALQWLGMADFVPSEVLAIP